jgi:2-polyprenyl-3-methyl-5-hydroxy-6-metoxy-1,4-benzoquinol methylase
MARPSDDMHFQAEHHPVVSDQTFLTLEEYCLHLIHRKAYEEAASLSFGKSVLDLGCNNGYGTVMLGLGCSRIVGLDVSSRAIEAARLRFGSSGVEFRLFNGQEIPFRDASFEMVVSFQVIEHIVDTASYITEISRVLRPDGIALFTTPNAAIRLDPGMRPWNPFHVREYVAEDLAKVLHTNFGDVSVRGLFAADDLYRIEFERCQAARKSARDASTSSAITILGRMHHATAAAMKAVLPNVIVELIRSVRKARNRSDVPPRPLDPALLAKYSTRDLFYRDKDLEKALDLMAICRTTTGTQNRSPSTP